MNNTPSISRSIFIVTAFFVCIAAIPAAFAAQEFQSVPSDQATIVAPEGLTERERLNLDKQYRFQYRQKGVILGPIPATGTAGTGFTPDAAAGGAPERVETEQEKLYRYFGVAATLYKETRYEEAIEVLKYIREREPEDDYVKNYLDRAKKAYDYQKSRWGAKTEKTSHALKTTRVNDLMSEGIAYYKQKRFDMALAKFSNVLALDPNNARAKDYYNKLKQYYTVETRADTIVQNFETKNSRQTSPVTGGYSAQDAASTKMLQAAETAMDKAAHPAAATIDKKANELLNRAELTEKIDGIIEQQSDDEKKLDQYTLGPGDVIEIVTYEHPELSAQVAVGTEGDVTLPLVNDMVYVKGLTVEEAAEKIREALKRYVREPSVAVSILAYRSKVFYVVDDSGATPYPITRANVTLRDALFLSDWGFNKALGRVIVMKPNKGNPIVKKVDAFDLIYRGNLRNDMRIGDGDVIYVPMTVVGKTTQTLNDTVAPFQAIQNARNLWLQGKWSQKGLKSEFRIYPDSQFLPQNVGNGD